MTHCRWFGKPGKKQCRSEQRLIVFIIKNKMGQFYLKKCFNKPVVVMIKKGYISGNHKNSYKITRTSFCIFIDFLRKGAGGAHRRSGNRD